MHQLNTKFRWLASHLLKKYVMGAKTPSAHDLEVLYLSKNYIVINKNCDIAINTDTPAEHPVTVATQLEQKFPHLYDHSVKFGFRFVHRLDYSTSGVLCVAANKTAAKDVSFAFNSRKAQKFYVALVHGHVPSGTMVISKPIGIDSRPDFSHCMCSGDKPYCIQPKPAVSKLLVLEHGLYNGNPASKVLLKLLTGKRHQLRVHCKEVGHTIVGDFTYSDKKDIYPYRMFLHALRLIMPCGEEKLDIMTKDPFTEDDPRNDWNPLHVFHNLNSETFLLFDMK